MSDQSIDRASGRSLPFVGQLRVGLVQAPAAGVFFVALDETRSPRGVTVDLARELARHLDLEPAFTVFPNSGECTEAVAAHRVDVAFMPVDDVRRGRVDFGPAYYLLRSTFLLAPGLEGCTVEGYRQQGRRFVGIAGTTTLRAAIRAFGDERATEARSVEDALAMFAAGDVDAVALSEDYLKAVQAEYPGASVMVEAFQQTSISIAVGKGDRAALDQVTAFLEDAKADGTVRDIFDRHGLGDEPVAPAGS